METTQTINSEETQQTQQTQEQLAFLEELYVARCKDTLEHPSREEFVRFSSRLKSKVSGPICSLRNQHLGSSSANTLSKFLRNRTDLFKLDLYCNLIRDQGLQVIAHFAQLNKSIRVLNVGCNDLTDKSAQHLAAIASVGHLRSLQLGLVEKSMHPNKLTTVTLDALSEAICKTDGLSSLGLNGSFLGVSSVPNVPFAEDSLIRMLSSSKTLLNLSLSNCEFSSSAMLRIIDEGLAYNSVLKRLDISCNDLLPHVGVRLGSYLLEPTKMRVMPEGEENPEAQPEIVTTNKMPQIFYLDAHGNQFTEEVVTVFATTLVTYPSLGYLDLSSNEIGDRGAIQIAEALATNQTLVELHLSNINITGIGGAAIVSALKTNATITTLNISKNRLGDDTARALALALRANKSLTTLNISTAMLSNDGGICIASATRSCPTLISLDMSDNFFTEDSGPALEKTFRENGNILKINVSGTQINHFSFHALNEICARNASLLKQKQQKSLRNQFVKSQYSSVELMRKQKILESLTAQRDDLQEQIDELNSKIATHKGEEETASSMLVKQIVEKEQQMENESVDFKQKMEELDQQLKDLEENKVNLEQRLEGQLEQNNKLKEEIDQMKTDLQKITDEFEASKNEKVAEIERLNKAADELLELTKDPERLAALTEEELPKLIEFEDDNKVDEKKMAEKLEAEHKKSSRRRKSTKGSKKSKK